jgi:hypothetical protein
MMKTSVIKFVTVICTSLALLTSCEYDIVVPEKIVPLVPDSVAVSFKDNVLPIFSSKCNMSGCHAAGAIPPDLSPANAYNSLINLNQIDTLAPIESNLYKEIKTGGGMVSYSNITTSEAALVLKWITEGAKNN